MAAKKKWLGDGYPTRYYIYDDDFTGLIALGDLKTHQLIEGRIYQNGKIVQYMYPKNGNIQKGVQAKITEQKQQSEESFMLDNITIYSTYGGGGNISFGNVILSNITIYSSYSNRGYSSGGGGVTGTYTSTQHTQKQVPKTPSDIIRNLLLQSKIKNALINLKEKSTTDNKETVYGAYINNKGEYETIKNTGTAEKVSLLVAPWVKLVATAHNHVVGTSTFSIQDIASLVTRYLSETIEPNNYTSFVLTHRNTAYAMVISDVTTFKAFAETNKAYYNEALTSREPFNEAFLGLFIDNNQLRLRAPRYDIDINEQITLSILEGLKTGITLWKSTDYNKNDDFQEWEQVKQR